MIFGKGISGFVEDTASLTISDVSEGDGDTADITTSASHGFTGGINEMVLIAGVVGSTEVNGLWYVTDIQSATEFTIDVGDAITAYTSGGTGKKGVAFKNGKMKPSYSIGDNIEHRSVINGTKTFIHNGIYTNIELTDQIFKYTEADRDEVADYVLSFLGDTVHFYPHLGSATQPSGNTIQDSASANIGFFVNNVLPYYLENTDFFDAVTVTLTGGGYSDLSKTTI